MKAKDEAIEAQFKIVRKNALANPNLYDGRFTQKDIRKARKEYLDLITNSEFLILMTKIASKNLMMNCYIKQWSIKK